MLDRRGMREVDPIHRVQGSHRDGGGHTQGGEGDLQCESTLSHIPRGLYQCRKFPHRGDIYFWKAERAYKKT